MNLSDRHPFLVYSICLLVIVAVAAATRMQGWWSNVADLVVWWEVVCGAGLVVVGAWLAVHHYRGGD